MLTWVGPLVAVACSIPFAIAVLRPSGPRGLAAAYARRRPRQALLVCAGIVVASAMFVSAALVGETLRASIRRSVVDQLGAVDQQVVRPGIDPAPVAAAISAAPGGRTATTVPLVAMISTVRGRDFVARVSQAQLIEVDFGAADRFSGGAGRSGLVGDTPAGDDAVMSADLSDSIAIAKGHRVTVYAFGSARTFTISRVLPRRGIAALRTPLSPAGSASYNLFVPIGTIRGLLGAAPNTATRGQGAPEAIVAVAAAPTKAAQPRLSAALQDAARITGADVRPLRRQLLDDAARRSRSLTDLFRSFAVFGALAGLALLVLAFAALAGERVRAMAMLRAHGLSQGGVISALALEGWLYALIGTALGMLCGWALARAVVTVAHTVFHNANSTNVELVFSSRPATLVAAGAAVFVIALVTIVAAAVLIARRNIAAALRRLPDPPRERRALARGIAAVLLAAGTIVTVAGIARANGVAAVSGPAVAAIGAVIAVGETTRRRRLVLVLAPALLAWSVLVVNAVPRAWTTVSGALIVTEGLVMTGAALALVSTLTRHPRLGRGSNRRRASALGSVYARRPSWRTLLVAATYATLLFMFTVLVAVRALYERDTHDLARRIGGTSTLEVSSNAAAPVPAADVAALPGVGRVKAAAATAAQLTTAGATETRDVTAVSIDSSWIASGSPPVDRMAGPSNEDPYGLVVHDPNRVLVGADLYADRQSGFPRGVPHVGDRVDLRVAATGVRRTLTVAGVVAAGRYDGSDHVYLARPMLDELLGSAAVSNLLFVDTQPGTNANVLAAIIDGTHLPNGAYARSFARLARDSNSARTQFLDISAGYAAVGLVAAIIAIAIVMADRVRERERQIAALRAFGTSSVVVRRSIRIETGLIAAAGMTSGVVCGLLLTWRFDHVDAFAAARGMPVPVVPLVVAVIVVGAASVLAAGSAGRRAARLQPARVLRADD